MSRYYDAITRSYRQYSKTYSAGSIKLTRPNVISLRELELHAAVEDLQVYRVFQQSESTRDAAHEALEAHGKIKTLLDQLEISPDYDHRWVAQFQEFQKLVEAHVAAEENEMFRKTEAIMTSQEAEELGVSVASAKQAISRNAPTTEGGTPEPI